MRREDLLLDNYSWVDRAQGKVRIPIERAMELIAQRGLPVAPAADSAADDRRQQQPVVTMPLTNGFARTGYEQDQTQAQAARRKRAKSRQFNVHRIETRCSIAVSSGEAGIT